jgi:alkylhydroperoxidase family enzyme
VPDNIYNGVKSHFTDREMVDLVMAVSNINTWNRINKAFARPVDVMNWELIG